MTITKMISIWTLLARTLLLSNKLMEALLISLSAIPKRTAVSTLLKRFHWMRRSLEATAKKTMRTLSILITQMTSLPRASSASRSRERRKST